MTSSQIGMIITIAFGCFIIGFILGIAFEGIRSNSEQSDKEGE